MKRKHLSVFIVTIIFSILLSACSEPQIITNYIPAANEDSFDRPEWIEKEPENLVPFNDDSTGYRYAYSHSDRTYYFFGVVDKERIGDTFTVPSSYNGLPVTRIHDSAFEDNTTLRTVTIPSSIKSIGDSAFEGCSALETVNFSQGLETIERDAFKNCKSLAELNLPFGLKSIDGWAFYGMSSLKTLEFPESIEYLGDGLFSSSGIETVAIPKNIDGITDSMFQNCQSLNEVILHEGVTKIGANAFRKSSYNFDDYDQITFYGVYAFAECQNFPDKIVIPEGTTFVGAGLFYKSAVKEVEMSEGVTEIPDNCFYGCWALTSVKVPDSVKRIGSNAFSNCTALNTSIHIPASLEEIGSYAFYRYKMGDRIELPVSARLLGEGAFRESMITGMSINAVDASIGRDFCRDCKALETVFIDSGTIGDYAFYGCEKPIQVTFGYDNVLGVRSIGEYAFSRSGVRRLHIYGSLTSIGPYAFANCSDLKYVWMPNSVKEVGEGAFMQCSSLQYVNSLSNYTFPENNSADRGEGAIASRLEVIGNSAFYLCDELCYIQLPPTVTWVGMYAFIKVYGVKDDLNMNIVVSSTGTDFHTNAFHDIYDSENFTVKIYGTTNEVRDAMKNTFYGDWVQNDLSPWGDGS